MKLNSVVKETVVFKMSVLFAAEVRKMSETVYSLGRREICLRIGYYSFL